MIWVWFHVYPFKPVEQPISIRFQSPVLKSGCDMHILGYSLKLVEAVANPRSFLNLRKKTLSSCQPSASSNKKMSHLCRKGSQLFRKWWSLAFDNKVAAQAANQTILGKKKSARSLWKATICLSHQKRPSKNLGSSASPNCIVFFLYGRSFPTVPVPMIQTFPLEFWYRGDRLIKGHF